MNPWIVVPFLDYILYGEGLPVAGKWVSLRELKRRAGTVSAFSTSVRRILQRVADSYTEFFDDLVQLFSGRQVAKQFDSDISWWFCSRFPKFPF